MELTRVFCARGRQNHGGFPIMLLTLLKTGTATSKLQVCVPAAPRCPTSENSWIRRCRSIKRRVENAKPRALAEKKLICSRRSRFLSSMSQRAFASVLPPLNANPWLRVNLINSDSPPAAHRGPVGQPSIRILHAGGYLLLRLIHEILDPELLAQIENPAPAGPSLSPGADGRWSMAEVMSEC